MKKAVIKVGGKQYTVAEKETLRVDLLPEGTKDLALDALLVIDGDKTTVGTPTVKGVKVSAKVVEEKVAGEKLRVIRYKSKKRVHKEIGHRQKYSVIEIVSIKQRLVKSAPMGRIFDVIYDSQYLCFLKQRLWCVIINSNGNNFRYYCWSFNVNATRDWA